MTSPMRPLPYLPLLLSLLLTGRPAVGQTLTQVTNFAVPSQLGLAALSSTVYTTGASYSLDTYNLSQPTTPVLLSSVTAGTPYPRQVIVGGTKAYVWGIGLGIATSSNLRVFDVSQPSAPVGGASLLLGPYPQYIAATGSLVAITNGFDGTVGYTPKLTIYDSNLNLMASVSLTTGANGVTLTGTTLYLQRAGIVDVYNLAVPTAPVRVTTFTGNIMAVSGSLAFGLNGSTLLVYDISNPLQPVLKGSTITNGGPLLTATASGKRVYTTGLYVEVSGGANNTTNIPLQAFDVSNPAAPTLLATAAVGSSARSGALAANGNTVYLIREASTVLQVYVLSGAPLAATPSAAASIDVYPNPAHGILTIERVPTATPVTLYDATGRVCLQVSLPITHLLDVSTLPGGVYTARIGEAIRRIVLF